MDKLLKIIEFIFFGRFFFQPNTNSWFRGCYREENIMFIVFLSIYLILAITPDNDIQTFLKWW